MSSVSAAMEAYDAGSREMIRGWNTLNGSRGKPCRIISSFFLSVEISCSFVNVCILGPLVHFRCEYLIQEKGQEFVHQIQARFPRLFEQVDAGLVIIRDWFMHLALNKSLKIAQLSFLLKSF